MYIVYLFHSRADASTTTTTNRSVFLSFRPRAILLLSFSLSFFFFFTFFLPFTIHFSVCLFSRGREAANQPHTQHQHHKPLSWRHAKVGSSVLYVELSYCVCVRPLVLWMSDGHWRWSGTERGINRNLILYTHNSVCIFLIFLFLFVSTFCLFVLVLEKNQKIENQTIWKRNRAEWQML